MKLVLLVKFEVNKDVGKRKTCERFTPDFLIRLLIIILVIADRTK